MTLKNKKLRLILIFIFGVCIGVIWHRLQIFPFPQLSGLKAQKSGETLKGRWRKARDISDTHTLTKKQKRMIEQLQSIGYLTGSKPAPDESNVTVYNDKLVYNGLNLVVSGHASEALLITLSGDIIHQWHCEITDAFPELVTQKESRKKYWQSKMYWRRVHLMENGDLYAIFEGVGLIKLDKDSNLLWSKNNFAHHDLSVAANGNSYVLTRKVHIDERYNAEKPIMEDYITVLDPDGNELNRVSILELLENSPFSSVLTRLKPSGDIFHTNTIELIEKISVPNSPFRPGTLLISILYLDLVCAVDLTGQTVYWAESDLWHRQHQPTLLENGRLLVYDNQGLRNASSVLEIDPLTRDILWSYRGGRDGAFYSETCGSCQRLPNGNTLITESDPGRAFEVTPDKTIVWEYVNPNRTGKNNELIATLFEVVRLPDDFPLTWIQ
jgi:hypothetical protein